MISTTTNHAISISSSSPNAKQKKKNNFKRSQRRENDAAMTEVNDCFKKLSTDDKISNERVFAASDMATTTATTVATNPGKEDKVKKKMQRKIKKKSNRKNKKYDATTAVMHNDYTTNAEGAAILALVRGGEHFYYGSFGSEENLYENSVMSRYDGSLYEGSMDGTVYDGVAGGYEDPMCNGGSAAAAAAAGYHYYPNEAYQHHQPLQNSVFYQQAPAVQDSAPYQHMQQINYPIYGMPPHPYYSSHVPVMSAHYPQQQLDENTPPIENGVDKSREKAKLNVDAPSFQPKKVEQ